MDPGMDTWSLAPEDKMSRGGKRGAGEEGEVIQSISDLKSFVILMIYETYNVLTRQRTYLKKKSRLESGIQLRQLWYIL